MYAMGHRICANIKQSEFVMLESPSKNNLSFCSSCVVNLPKTLDFFTNQSQLDEKFKTKFQSMEDKLSQKITDVEAKLQDYRNTVLGTRNTMERGSHNQLREHSYLTIQLLILLYQNIYVIRKGQIVRKHD